MRKFLLAGVVLGLALVGACRRAEAAIVWDPNVKISTRGDSVVATSGTLCEAINFGESTDRTVNSVTFVGNTTGGFSTYSDFTKWSTAATIPAYTQGGISEDFEGMLNSALSLPQGGNSFTLQGLMPGCEYIVQFFAHHVSMSQTGIHLGGTTPGKLASNTPGSSLAHLTTGDEQTTVTGGIGMGNLNVSGYQLRLISEPVALVASLTASPLSGSLIFLGTDLSLSTPATVLDAISLTNTGDPGSTIDVTAYSLTGTNPNFFAIPDWATAVLTADGTDNVLYDPTFLGSPTQGSYSALLTINTSEGDVIYNLQASVIPEPGTLALLAMGLLGLGFYAWRRSRR